MQVFEREREGKGGGGGGEGYSVHSASNGP